MYFNPSSIKRLDYIFKGLFKSKKKCTKVGGVGNGSHIVIIYTNFCVIEHGMFLLFEISEFYHVCGFNFIF